MFFVDAWTRLCCSGRVCFCSLSPSSSVCLCLCLDVCVCVCVWEGEGFECAWVCLTFNILTSYFKNVKLCKHVALADCLTPLPLPLHSLPAFPSPAAVRVTRVTIHLSPAADDSAVPLTTSLSKCQRSAKKNNNKSSHTHTRAYI